MYKDNCSEKDMKDSKIQKNYHFITDDSLNKRGEKIGETYLNTSPKAKGLYEILCNFYS